MTQLDTKVIDTYPKLKPQPFGVGLEVEVEGKIKVNPGSSGWDTHADGSLRNGGIEFVTRGAIAPDTIERYVHDLKRLTKGSQFQPSIRTSLHVHVNAQQYTLKQVYVIMMMYWLFEDALVSLNNPFRKSNLHCLRLSDSYVIFDNALRELRTTKPFALNGGSNLRYAALNLASIPKFGTVEFRFMEFSQDLDEVTVWGEALAHFVQQAAKVDIPQLLRILEAPVEDVSKVFWTPELHRRLMANPTELSSSWMQHHDYIRILAQKIDVLKEAPPVVDEDYDDEDHFLSPDDPILRDYCTPSQIAEVKAGSTPMVYWVTGGRWVTLTRKEELKKMLAAENSLYAQSIPTQPSFEEDEFYEDEGYDDDF